MKSFAAAAALFASAEAWYLPYSNFDAISNWGSPRYWMEGKYGANNMGWFGTYAYIYFEVGGAEIEDGAVVTMFDTV